MNLKLTSLAAAMIVAGAATSAAFAADMSDMPPLPPEQTRGAVQYVTGGVSVDEADTFRRAAAAYPLELQFVQRARPKDEFLANVNVTIRGRSGNVLLETATDGPFLLARLPAGRYSIEAEHDGVTKRQSVDIRPGRHQRSVFVWAALDISVERPLAARTEREPRR